MVLTLQALSLISPVILVFYLLAFFIITFFAQALFLMIATKIFKTENKDYKTAMKVLWLPLLVSLVLTIVLVLAGLEESSVFRWVVSLLVLGIYTWIIKNNYYVSAIKAFFIAIVSMFFLSIFYSIVFILIAAVAWTIIRETVMSGAEEIQYGISNFYIPLIKNLVLN